MAAAAAAADVDRQPGTHLAVVQLDVVLLQGVVSQGSVVARVLRLAHFSRSRLTNLVPTYLTCVAL